MANILNPDDEVEVVIVKAKPKYPNQMFTQQQVSASLPSQKATKTIENANAQVKPINVVIASKPVVNKVVPKFLTSITSM